MLICLFNCWGYHFSNSCLSTTWIKCYIFHWSLYCSFWRKMLQFDKTVLLGDVNVSLNVNNDASKRWNWFLEDFGLTQYVCETAHRSGGILDHIIASNNISINVKSNSFITSSDISFICFSLSIVKQRKSQQQFMYRNGKKFGSDGYWSRA